MFRIGYGSVLVLIRPSCYFAWNLNTVKLKSTYTTLVLLFQDFLIRFNSIIKENSFTLGYIVKKALGLRPSGSRSSTFLGSGPEKNVFAQLPNRPECTYSSQIYPIAKHALKPFGSFLPKWSRIPLSTDTHCHSHSQ